MRRRFFLLLVTWTAAAVAGVGVLALRMVAAARQNVRVYHEQLADHAMRNLDRFARDLNDRASVVADLQRLPADSPLLLGTLQSAAALHGDLAILSLLDVAGQETVRFADSRLFPAATPRELWQAAAARSRTEREPTIGAVALQDGAPILPIAYPLNDGRMLLMGISLSPLWDSFRAEHVGKSGRVVVADGEGRLLPPVEPGLPEVLPVSAQDASGWFESGGEGGWVGAFQRSKPLGWIAATIEPAGEAYGRARSFLVAAVLMFVLLALAAAASAGWITGKIALPLADIMEAANRSSQNVFTVPIPERGWPEVRALAARFNHMMRQLKAYQDLQIEKVLEEKSKVDALVHTIPEGLLMADMQGNVLFSNNSLFTIMTKAHKTPNRQGKLNVVLPDPKVLQMAELLMRRENRWAFCETEVQDSNGLRRFLKVLGTVVTVDGGGARRDSGILLLFRDITLEKQLDQMKEEFFHSVIHDLRNPLTTIQMVVEVTGKALKSDPKMAEYHKVAMRASGELNDLLTDVLDLAKLESGQYTLTPEPTDLLKVAQESVSLLAFRASAKGIQLELVPEGAVPPVPAEGHKLGRVISNLIGNAIKFTPNNGQIRVHVGATADGARITVADTGPGIPQDKLKMVFEKFTQVDKARDERAGFGLGLTICKRFVELHGGRIWAESPPGQGARFIFTVPLRAPAPKTQAMALKPQAR